MLITALQPIVILGHHLWAGEGTIYRKSLGLRLVRRPGEAAKTVARRREVLRMWMAESACGRWVPDTAEPWVVR